MSGRDRTVNGGITWVAYIADLMRRADIAALQTAWVQLYAQWGNQAHDMWALAKTEARDAEQAGAPMQAGLW